MALKAGLHESATRASTFVRFYETASCARQQAIIKQTKVDARISPALGVSLRYTRVCENYDLTFLKHETILKNIAPFLRRNPKSKSAVSAWLTVFFSFDQNKINHFRQVKN